MTHTFFAAIFLSFAAFMSGWSVHSWRADAAISKIKEQHALEQAESAAWAQAAADVARADQERLQELADKRQESDNEKINDLGTRAARLAQRVRSAEAAAATAKLMSSSAKNAGNPEASSLGDGAELLRQIGTTDVEEAQRADTIRVALLSCYAAADDYRNQTTKGVEK